MDELGQGVIAESPTATESTPAADPSAGTLNTESSAQGPGPIPYDRFQQVVQARQQAEWQAQQYQQQLTAMQHQLQALQQPRQTPAAMSPEEQAAATALKKIIQADPELRRLWLAHQAMPQLLAGYQTTQQLQQMQQQHYLRSGRGEIERLASTSSLPVTPEAADYYETLVADVIRKTPGAHQRFAQGDLSVVAEAWSRVQQFLGQFSRPATQQLIDTKQQVRRLPPRPNGAAPGAPLPPQLAADASPQDVRAFTRDMHADAARAIAAAQASTR